MKLIVLSTLAILATDISFGSGWIKKANYGGAARHRTTAFSIGNKGYLGLGHVNSGPQGNVLFEDFWSYDPASNSWSQIADYGGGLRYHSSCFVINGKAYVGTGRNNSGSYTTDFWEYNPVTNAWTAVASLNGPSRRGGVGFALNGKGYVGTGQTYSGVSDDFYQYDPIADSWTALPDFPGPARTSSVAFEINNKAYMGTGGQATWGNSTDDFWEFDPTLNQWTQLPSVPGPTRMEATGFSVHGKAIIGTGDNFSSGTNYKDFYVYDPVSSTWDTTEIEFDGLARRYLSSFVINNTAYTGTGTNGTNFKDFWAFDLLLSTLDRDKSLLSVNVYPNPATDYIRLKLDKLPQELDWNETKLVVYNQSGQIIQDIPINSDITTIQTADWSKGLYIFRLSYKSVEVRNGKFLIL